MCIRDRLQCHTPHAAHPADSSGKLYKPSAPGVLPQKSVQNARCREQCVPQHAAVRNMNGRFIAQCAAAVPGGVQRAAFNVQHKAEGLSLIHI